MENKRILMDVMVVYFNPLDYPNKFVARWQRVWDDGYIEAYKELFAIGDTIDEVRKNIPDHLVRLERHPNDVKSIVETWI